MRIKITASTNIQRVKKVIRNYLNKKKTKIGELRLNQTIKRTGGTIAGKEWQSLISKKLLKS